MYVVRMVNVSDWQFFVNVERIQHTYSASDKIMKASTLLFHTKIKVTI